MSVIEEKVVHQLSEILDLWRVTYSVEDEKYIAKTNSFIVLNSEQIEWINQMGLSIFSIQKYEDTLVIRFVSGGKIKYGGTMSIQDDINNSIYSDTNGWVPMMGTDNTNKMLEGGD